MFDLIGALLDLVLEAGGVPGFDTLEAQRRARIVAAVVALGAVVSGSVMLGSRSSVVLIAVGALIALWVAAFSLVDVAKERPAVPWASVTVIFLAGASLATAIGLAVTRK